VDEEKTTLALPSSVTPAGRASFPPTGEAKNTARPSPLTREAKNDVRATHARVLEIYHYFLIKFLKKFKKILRNLLTNSKTCVMMKKKTKEKQKM
jgi:hypothetical protein